MAMKKGYCINCNKHDEQRRIFDVNSEARWCYCPRCGKKYPPKVAIANYERMINHYLRRAKFFLKNVVESTYSYSLYGYILELEPENSNAKLGRLLSLAFMSTLRRNRFLEVKELLDMSKDEFHLVRNRKEYCSFLKSLDKCLNEYIERVRKILSTHSYFYDTDCLKLYYQHVRDTIMLKRTIVAEFSEIQQKDQFEKVSESIKELESKYKEVFYTVDGVDHYFANFTKKGDVLITDGQKKIDVKLTKRKMYSLDAKNKKTKVFKERVFPGMGITLFNIFEKCFIIAGTLLALSVIALVFYLIFIKLSFSPILLSIFIVFSVFGVGFIALRLLIGIILKRPRA